MPNSVKAGVATAFFTFLTTFLIVGVGWLNDVIAWVSADRVGAFPDISVLGSAGLAAIVGFASAVLNIVVRYVQDRYGVGPATPIYTPPGEGE